MLSVERLVSAGRIEALHGVSLEVQDADVVALIGANGAGKTTVLRAISGVQIVTAGSIRFFDKPLLPVATRSTGKHLEINDGVENPVDHDRVMVRRGAVVEDFPSAPLPIVPMLLSWESYPERDRSGHPGRSKSACGLSWL